MLYTALLFAWALIVFFAVRGFMSSVRSKHAVASPTDPVDVFERHSAAPDHIAAVSNGDGEDIIANSANRTANTPAHELTKAQWLACPCPQVARCASTDLEQRCLEYLANTSNILSIRPMVSNLRVGRTAKMRVIYRNPCVQGIAKMPQSLFPLEPYAEYVAFEVDRVLSFGYVPPTSFTFLPMAGIEAAAADFANKQQRQRRRAGLTEAPEATDPSHEYARWVSTEVLGYAMRKGLIVPHPETGKLVLGVSVQLFLRGVRPPRKTVLQEEDAYAQLLRSPALLKLATGPDAATVFTARKAMSLCGTINQLIMSHRQRMKSDRQRAHYDPHGDARRGMPYQHAVDNHDGDGADDTDGDTRRELAEINALVEAIGALNEPGLAALSDVVRYMSDRFVFDAIIGNDDRGPVKNANVYTVDPAILPPECDIGGRRHWTSDERSAATGEGVRVPPEVPVVRRVLLDQGKSLYKEGLIFGRLDVPLRPHSAQCLFRRSTNSVLQGLRHGDLFRALQHILPPQIIAAVGEHRLVWASQRAETIADHARQCGLALGGDAKIHAWD